MPTKKLVVLSGAGISAESGLATFRDSGGLWEGYNIQDVATPEAWNKNPELVLDFYNLRREQASVAEPNAAHLAFAELEALFDVEVITQNVDNLHEKAGSTKVLHLHGELTKARSVKDEDLILDIGYNPIKLGDTGDDGAQLRPHIVWFGEMVPKLEEAAQVVASAEILVVIGTSLVVYPAASLVHYAPANCHKFIIDPSVPELHSFDSWTHFRVSATEGVELLKEKLKTHYV